MRTTSFCIIRCYPKSKDGFYDIQSSSLELHPMDYFEHWMQKRNDLIKETLEVFILKDIPVLTESDNEINVSSILSLKNGLAYKRQIEYLKLAEKYDESVLDKNQNNSTIKKNELFHEYIKELEELDSSINQEFTEFLSKFEKLEFNNDIQEG